MKWVRVYPFVDSTRFGLGSRQGGLDRSRTYRQ